MNQIFVNKSLIFGVLEVSGADALSFLQGQLTCDMRKITEKISVFGARCNLQGRVIFLAKIFLHQNNFYLIMPQAMIDIAINELKKFVLRSKVTFRDATNDVEFQSYLQNPTQNIAWIIPETSQKYLPHDLNYLDLDAISFKKGCYIGQEIIARMHYRAELKKHLVFLEAENKENLIINYNDKLITVDENNVECHFEVVDFQIEGEKLKLLGVLYKKQFVPKCLKLSGSSFLPVIPAFAGMTMTRQSGNKDNK